MKILITGSNGMVGTALKKVLDDDLILTDKSNLDVTNYQEVMFYTGRWGWGIDFIIHLAAETDLETCEKDPAHAYLTNTIGTFNMIELARFYNKPILFMSTAGVFEGNRQQVYYPHELPNPVNVYGRSKFYAEKIAVLYRYSYIIRAGWMMGGGADIDKKFVNKIIKKINSGEKVIKVVSDCYGSPTYTMDLANNIKKVVDGYFDYGIYHCTNQGSASRYDVAKEIVRLLNKDVEIVPVVSDKVSDEFPCKRSNNELIALSEGFEMSSWQDSLARYLDAEFKH